VIECMTSMLIQTLFIQFAWVASDPLRCTKLERTSFKLVFSTAPNREHVTRLRALHLSSSFYSLPTSNMPI